VILLSLEDPKDVKLCGRGERLCDRKKDLRTELMKQNKWYGASDPYSCGTIQTHIEARGNMHWRYRGGVVDGKSVAGEEGVNPNRLMGVGSIEYIHMILVTRVSPRQPFVGLSGRNERHISFRHPDELDGRMPRGR
jgi:hypothetical protein